MGVFFVFDADDTDQPAMPEPTQAALIDEHKTATSKLKKPTNNNNNVNNSAAAATTAPTGPEPGSSALVGVTVMGKRLQ